MHPWWCWCCSATRTCTCPRRRGSLRSRRNLKRVARALGRSPFSVFRTIVLPQSWGAIAGGTLLVFLYAVSDFGAVSLMRYDTLTLRIEATRLFDRDISLTLSFLLAAVALTVVVAERATVRRRAGIEAVGAGRRPLQFPLGWTRVPALAFVIVLSGFALDCADRSARAVDVTRARRLHHRRRSGCQPFGAMDAAGEHRVDLGDRRNRHGGRGLADRVPHGAVPQSRVGGAVNTVVVGGFALPGLVIALALVYWVLQAPGFDRLYQTYPLLVFAYAVHFGAQGLRASQESVAGLPRRIDDADAFARRGLAPTVGHDRPTADAPRPGRRRWPGAARGA